jgi:hypothetical protein
MYLFNAEAKIIIHFKKTNTCLKSIVCTHMYAICVLFVCVGCMSMCVFVLRVYVWVCRVYVCACVWFL